MGVASAPATFRVASGNRVSLISETSARLGFGKPIPRLVHLPIGRWSVPPARSPGLLGCCKPSAMTSVGPTARR